MIKKRLACAIWIGLLCLLPTAAQADDDVLGWFGEISGPGPYRPDLFAHLIGGYSGNIFCMPNDPKDRKVAQIACQLYDGVDDTDGHRLGGDAKWLITFAYTQTVTDRNARPANTGLFKDDPRDDRDANERAFSFMAMYRANRTVDIGVGVEILRWSGDAGSDPVNYPSFGFTRLGLVPARVNFTPLGGFSKVPRNLRRLIHFQIEEIWLPQTTSGVDFHNARTSFTAGPEFQTYTAVSIDVLSLYRLVTNK